MHKNTITMDKPWPTTVSFASHLHEVFGKLRNIVAVPTGYQDKTGFHVGAEPFEKEVNWSKS